MKAMRIGRYGGPETLQYEEVPCPTPDKEELLIRVHAAGVNHLDWKVRQGYIRVPFEWTMRAGHAPLRSPDTLPIIPGFDVAGVVEAVGAGVKRFAVGDEVFASPAFGGYAEYVTVSVDDVAYKPHSLDFVEAAAMPVSAISAWQGLSEVMNLKRGQTLLIHGAAGGVGTFAVQLAKWQGAHVIGTASGHNLAYLHQLGADETIDYTTTRFEDIVREVDAILDLVGGETQERSWSVLKPTGILATISSPLSRVTAAENPPHLYVYKMLRPVGRQLAELAHLVDAGKLKPYISHVLPLQEARRAHILIESRHTRGKIALRVVE